MTSDDEDKVTEEYDPYGSLTSRTIEHPPKKTASDRVAIIAQVATAVAVVVSIIALAVGVFQFKAQQSDSAQMQATQEAVSRAQTLDQQRQTTLDTYLDRIQDLLLNANLRTSSDAQSVAAARTFTVLRYLDGNRKAYLIRFLYDAYLIGYFDKYGSHLPIINVYGFDLSGAVFATATLRPNLRGVYLSYDNLYGANLSGVDLSHAVPSYAYLQGANLSGADLSGADLSGANVTQQQLDQVRSCKNAILPQGLACHQNQ